MNYEALVKEVYPTAEAVGVMTRSGKLRWLIYLWIDGADLSDEDEGDTEENAWKSAYNNLQQKQKAQEKQ